MTISLEGGKPIAGSPAPFGTIAVNTPLGPQQITTFRSPAVTRADGQTDILLALGGTAEPIAPIFLGHDLGELVGDLDLPSQRRLLGFLLGFCRKGFEVGNDPVFVANCLRLAERCVVQTGSATMAAKIGDTWTLLVGLDPSINGSIYRISHGRIRRLPVVFLASHGEHAVEHVEAGDLLLTVGEHPAMWSVAAPAQSLPDLMRQAAGGGGLRDAAVAALLAASPEFCARLRERALLQPAAPIRHDDPRRPVAGALEAALPDGNGALFLRGWLRDPAELVVSAKIVAISGVQPLELAAFHRFGRADLEQHFRPSPFKGGETKLGFVALINDPCLSVPYQPELRLQLQSGATILLRPPMQLTEPANARAAVLAAVPAADVSDAMFQTCLSPAAAAFHRKLLLDRSRPEHIEIGTPVANPSVSIIVPLYRNLSFLRFQVAALARDPDCRDAELIYILDSPEQRGEVEHLLRGLHILYGLPLRLVVMRRNLGYAAATNAGAAHARAAKLLLLNSDVIPTSARWLPIMLAELNDAAIGAVGPKLLFDDGSIQHAGMMFQRGDDDLWFNAHYHKGRPAAWPAADYRRLVPAVTGACVLLRRHHFEEVGGVSEDYIIGDYEDSDLCLRLRTLGLEISYMPEATLFHFERKSISSHPGYAGTLACRHNRWIHHNRWNDTIEELMAWYAAAGDA